MSELLQLDGFSVGYNKRRLLPPVTMTLNRGDQWALVGPNGSGKTTLLKSMLGLLPSVDGSISITDHVAYVPQRSAIDSRLPARVIDVVRSGVDRGFSFLSPTHQLSRAEAVEKALQETQTDGLVDSQLSELSEGQKQRVLVARALAGDPSLLILDEPTSAMDATAETTVFELLHTLRESRNLGVLVVSHHLPVVVRYATHMLAVDKDRQFVFSGSIDDAMTDRDLSERYVHLAHWVTDDR